MTMQGMVDYLESKGFWVRKKYNSEKHVYEFTISKDDKYLYREFPYPDSVTRLERNLLMEDFLDKMLEDFDNGFNSKPLTLNEIRELYGLPRINEKTLISKREDAAAALADGLLAGLEIGKDSFKVGNWEFSPGKNGSTNFRYVDTDNVDSLYPKITQVAKEYAKLDVEMTQQLYKMMANRLYGGNNSMMAKIKKVHFNDPMTIVIWSDGTKTIVKAKNEAFDPEKGLAMAIAKKAMGNKYSYIKEFEKWIPKPVEEPKPIGKVTSITEKDGGVTATVELTDILDF